ncbi:MAG: patatin-like phospholipase family protein [Minicystis sp.]
MHALSLPGCACRATFQVGVLRRLAAAGERFDVVAGASSGSVCGAILVAGMIDRGPELARELAGAPIVSTRYLGTERSIFGMGRILRDALRKHLPERVICESDAELLVATTHAGHYVRRFIPERVLKRGGFETAHHDPLVVHSSRERRDIHEVIVASCYIPVIHAGVARLDGALHVDGALADNTLIDALVARGATEITRDHALPARRGGPDDVRRRGAAAPAARRAHPRALPRAAALHRPLRSGPEPHRGGPVDAIPRASGVSPREDPVAARRGPA